jgi:hypothetical protein
MPTRSSHGDDPNDVLRLGVHDRDYLSLEQAERHESVLSVGPTRVFQSYRMAVEDRFGIEEVDPMLDNVGSAFVFVPFEPHGVDRNDTL